MSILLNLSGFILGLTSLLNDYLNDKLRTRYMKFKNNDSLIVIFSVLSVLEILHISPINHTIPHFNTIMNKIISENLNKLLACF